MNKRQMNALWIGLSIVLLMSLLPVRESAGGGVYRSRGFAFHHKIAKYGPYDNKETYYYTKIDLETTIGQMLPVIILTSGLILALKDKKSDSPERAKEKK